MTHYTFHTLLLLSRSIYVHKSNFPFIRENFPDRENTCIKFFFSTSNNKFQYVLIRKYFSFRFSGLLNCGTYVFVSDFECSVKKISHLAIYGQIWNSTRVLSISISNLNLSLLAYLYFAELFTSARPLLRHVTPQRHTEYRRVLHPHLY